MKPTLFIIGGLPAPAYAVFMVLGFVLALVAIMKITPPRSDRPSAGGFHRGQASDLFLIMVLAALFGAKVGHCLFEAPGHVTEDGRMIHTVWELLREDPFHWLDIAEPGYVWYGGMLGCLITAVIYFRRMPHLNAWLFSDAFAPAVMVGAFIGRLGCFLAGCCYGVPTDSWFGVHFPHLDEPVHPTQLYDATAALGVGSYLWWKFPRRRFDGENIALLLILYPILRASTEIFRGDPERGTFGPLSTSQWISVPLLVLGIYLYRRRQSQGPATLPGALSQADGPPASVEGRL